MAEHGTFSAVIDDVLARSLRKDRVLDIVAYARTTLRECLVLARFDQDFVEDEITANVIPFIWPKPQTLRSLAVVKYPYWDRQNKPVYPPKLQPSREGRYDMHYFYASGNSFVFAGLTLGDKVLIGYHAYSRKFKYFTDNAEKPAIFDDETNLWTYHDDYNDNAITQEAARDLVTHWLVFDWFDAIVEGTLAKLYKQVGDERSKSAYGLYKSFQADILEGSSATFTGTSNVG